MAEGQIRVEPITDQRVIDETLRHPRVYRHIRDDFCPEDPRQFSAPAGPFLYLAAYHGAEYLGLFMLQAHSAVLWEVHTCLLPTAWGGATLACTAACAQWMWERTPCQRLITAVPEGNELALRLARRSGMADYGVNPRSLQRGGRLLDQTMLGMSRS